MFFAVRSDYSDRAYPGSDVLRFVQNLATSNSSWQTALSQL
jgi:hypothetical protein